MSQPPNPNPTNPSTLYPLFETEIPPLSSNAKFADIVRIEKEFVTHLTNQLDPLEDVVDKSIIPNELISGSRKNPKPKFDPLKRLNEMPTEEAEEEEETEDEENEDEEVVGDEEDDAGGDYIVTHFDNGEGFEDNDEDGDDMTSMM